MKYTNDPCGETMGKTFIGYQVMYMGFISRKGRPAFPDPCPKHPERIKNRYHHNT